MALRGDLSSNFTHWSTFAGFRAEDGCFQTALRRNAHGVIVRQEGEIIGNAAGESFLEAMGELIF